MQDNWDAKVLAYYDPKCLYNWLGTHLPMARRNLILISILIALNDK